MAANARKRSILSFRLRGLNIAFRTLHIVVIAALFGGHLFTAETKRLLPWLYASVLTGLVLLILEAIPEQNWFLQVCGILTMGKLLVLCLVPLFWGYRIPMLVGVIVLGSIGSHMPRRFRHYHVFDSK